MAVLATLFLLSYAKLLCSIINPLFFTFLEYPSGTKEVWLVDGNIPYLKGKHIPLFLSSLPCWLCSCSSFPSLCCCYWDNVSKLNLRGSVLSGSVTTESVPWTIQEQTSLLEWTSACDQVLPFSGFCFQC